MHDLKIYIVIEDPKTRQDVSIRGNFEVLQAFLSGVAPLKAQDVPMLSSQPMLTATITHSTKGKPAKDKSILTA